MRLRLGRSRALPVYGAQCAAWQEPRPPGVRRPVCGLAGAAPSRCAAPGVRLGGGRLAGGVVIPTCDLHLLGDDFPDVQTGRRSW